MLHAPDRRRLYEQLAQQLRLYVELNGLQPGDRLPSERDLAAELQVSRASLRQATVALEVAGVLEVRHGGGIYVRSVDGTPGQMADLLRQRDRLPEVLEAREALETMIARRAAERRNDEDLAAIDHALQVMADEIAAGGLGDRGDEMFHRAVTAAAHNRLLADLMRMIGELIRESRVTSLSEPGRPEKSLAGHRRIADAIRRGDARAAQSAMRRHLQVVADVGLLRWQLPGQQPATPPQ